MISGITIITLNIGEYKCRDCLERALLNLNFINKLQIKEEDGIFTLTSSIKADDYSRAQVSMELQDQLEQIHLQILPKYTEFHAIHSLESQGFELKKTYQTTLGYKSIFERIQGSGTNIQVERYDIEVIPSEKRVIVDGGNMPSLTCKKHIKSFQNSMGILHSFTPHSNLMESIKPQKEKVKEQVRMNK